MRLILILPLALIGTAGCGYTPVSTAPVTARQPVNQAAPAAGAKPVNVHELPPGETVSVIPTSSGPSVRPDLIPE